MKINKTFIIIAAHLLILLLLTSCSSKVREYYSGIITDETGAPIQGVLIREDLLTGNNGTTDSTGYFKIKRTHNTLPDLILSKKGYRTDTVRMVWLMHGEKEMYSDFLTKSSSKRVMYEIIYKDSTLNWSDKLRYFDNDSIEMSRDGRLMYTQYLNRGKGEIIYRYYNFGETTREVYNIDTELNEIHFRAYNGYDRDSVEYTGYVSSSDSVPDLLKDNWGDYFCVGVIKKKKGGELLSESYHLWRSFEHFVKGKDEDAIGEKTSYRHDNGYEITKYTDEGRIYWDYYPNGQLKRHGDVKWIYGGMFSTFLVSFDSLGHKKEEINWEHLYPEWGESYNHTFIIEITREYYPNGRLKFLMKTKAFSQSDGYRCGTWVYYDKQGKVVKKEKYGDCYNFELEDKYFEGNFEKEE